MGRRKGSLNKSTIAKMKMLEEAKIVQDKNTTPISLSKEEEGISVQTTTEQPDWTERSNSVGRPKLSDSEIENDNTAASADAGTNVSDIKEFSNSFHQESLDV